MQIGLENFGELDTRVRPFWCLQYEVQNAASFIWLSYHSDLVIET